MPLDARIEAKRLRELYQTDPRQQSFNLLLIGEKGTGKTNILKTARKPVHIDSFDPGGTATLRREIEKGDIVADTKNENDDPLHPKQYLEWKKDFETRRMNNYFDSFGTYCLDSCTTWSQTIMNWVLATIEAGKSHAGEAPKWNRDYKVQRSKMDPHIRQMLSLPCDFILTGHLEGITETKRIPDGQGGYDEIAEIVEYSILATGALKVLIPTLFSEMWVTTIKESARGPVYGVLTSRKGKLRASTRMSEGKFLQEEEPNIKNLLKKAGWDSSDKPPLY